jgi:hypothetical protein
VVSPGAASAASRTADLICAEGTGCAIDDRDRIACALDGDRKATALRHTGGSGTHECDRIEDTVHRPLAERGVAVEGCDDRTARHCPHHQPAAGGGIAEIQHIRRLPEATDADPLHPPNGFGSAHDGRAQRPHSLAGVEHILALQETGYAGLAHRQRAEDERAVRDRLVARHAQAAAKRPAAARGERDFRGIVHGRPRRLEGAS